MPELPPTAKEKPARPALVLQLPVPLLSLEEHSHALRMFEWAQQLLSVVNPTSAKIEQVQLIMDDGTSFSVTQMMITKEHEPLASKR